MPVHRKVDISSGFSADYDWADANESPDAVGANQVTGLVEHILVPRPGVDILWSVTYYDGDSSSAVSVPAAGATFAGEVVFEGGSDSRQYKAMTASGTLAVKLAVLEPDLPVMRRAWVRLTAAGATPMGATHLWVTYELVERRGT